MTNETEKVIREFNNAISKCKKMTEKDYYGSDEHFESEESYEDYLKR